MRYLLCGLKNYSIRVSSNVEVTGAARLYRGASVLTERLGICARRASTGAPLELDLSVTDGIDELVNASVARLTAFVFFKVL